MDYIVLFDVASKPRPWWGAVFLVLFAAAALFVGRRNAPDASERKRWTNLVLSRMGATLAIVALFGSAYAYEKDRQRMMASLVRGDVSVVEGLITKIVKPRAFRNGRSCFTVESRSFCYSDNKMTPAFNTRNSKDSPIREGRWIRVTHQGESILRLETTTSGLARVKSLNGPDADRK